MNRSISTLIPSLLALALALNLPIIASAEDEEKGGAEPRPRQGHALVSDGRELLHLLGGNDGARMLWEHWVFDPHSGAWQELKMPASIIALNAMEAVYSQGLIVLVGSQPITIGSRQAPTTNLPNPSLLNSVYTYDTTTSGWLVYNPDIAPSARQGYSLATLGDGRILLFGGTSLTSAGDWLDLGDSWLLDPKQGSWERLSTTGSPQARRLALLGGLKDGRAVLAGGSMGEEAHGSDSWEFDLGTKTWSKIEGESFEPFTLASGTCLSDGSFLMQRQFAEGEYPGDLWLYLPAKRLWEKATGASGIETRVSPIAAFGGSLWIFSGFRSDELFYGLESFELAGK